MNLKKKEKKLNSETLLVTIDIGKNKNYGYARCPDGSELDVFDFNNSGKGFVYFTSKVERYRDKMGLRRILFGLESTGSYGEALMHYLQILCLLREFPFSCFQSISLFYHFHRLSYKV